MGALDTISVRVESAGDLTRNALPILHEIRHALTRLVAAGETTVIDLFAIPFGPGDERLLLEALGEGEVTAHLHALGESRIVETTYPGVWLIDHHNADGQRIAYHIEIANVPQVLSAQAEDVADGLRRLESALAGSVGPDNRPANNS
jgi:hydrogenase-1 operon protein HyaF